MEHGDLLTLTGALSRLERAFTVNKGPTSKSTIFRQADVSRKKTVMSSAAFARPEQWRRARVRKLAKLKVVPLCATSLLILPFIHAAVAAAVPSAREFTYATLRGDNNGDHSARISFPGHLALVSVSSKRSGKGKEMEQQYLFSKRTAIYSSLSFLSFSFSFADPEILLKLRNLKDTRGDGQ